MLELTTDVEPSFDAARESWHPFRFDQHPWIGPGRQLMMTRHISSADVLIPNVR